MRLSANWNAQRNIGWRRLLQIRSSHKGMGCGKENGACLSDEASLRDFVVAQGPSETPETNVSIQLPLLN